MSIQVGSGRLAGLSFKEGKKNMEPFIHGF